MAAKTSSPEVDSELNADAPQAGMAEPDITLDDFCAGLSVSDKRVELIGAFHCLERHAGHQRAQHDVWAARYTAFQSMPV